MKKILNLVMVLTMMFVAFSCDKKKNEPVVDKTFNEVLNDEYKSIKDTAPDVVFYESQVILDTTQKDTMVIVEYLNIYQNGKQCIQALHFGDSVAYKKVNDFWCEDIKIDPDTLNLSIEGAYERYMEADIVKPEVLRCVTLRCPLGPKVVNPQYYFGQGKMFIAVDAMTGDVTSVK